MRNKKQKKAMGIEDALAVIYRLVFVTVAVFIFVLFVNLLVDPFPDVNEAKAEIVTGRLLYSDVLYYTHPTTGRVYNNIIDFDRLNTLDLSGTLESYFDNNFYIYGRVSDPFAFKLAIYFSDPNYIYEFYSDIDQYKVMAPKKFFSLKGAVTEKRTVFETKCYTNPNIEKCTVELTILVPNS
jgi:hypothetical protein